MIDLNLLKLLDVISPGGNSSVMGNIGQQPQQPQNPMGIDDQALMQMLNPKDEQFDRFTSLINQIPQRQNYQPSMGRKIAGFVAGLGTGGAQGISGGQPIGYKSDIPEGLKVQQNINDMPYNRAVNDWLSQTGPTLEAAKMENTRNVNSRIGASNVRSAQIREEGESRKRNWDFVREGDLEEKRRQTDEKIEISRQRAAAYKFDKEHPNHVYKEDNDGNIFSVNPKDDTIQYLFDENGSKIKSKNLSDEMKMKISHENRMGEIGARGQESRKTEILRQTDKKELEEVKTREAPKRAAAKATDKPQSETQKKAGNFNRATQYLNSHPDAKGYILLSPGNNFEVVMPKGGSPTTYKDIYRFVYGEEPKVAGKILMLSPDGKTKGMIPADQYDAAIKAGYKDTK